MQAVLNPKQAEFNAAMLRYASSPIYRWIGRLASLVNVGGQLTLLALLWHQSPGWWVQLALLCLAYASADFVNGWVHLHMDNGDRYTSFAGPFYAAFHLHHRSPRYRQRSIPLVYYQEAGSKIWLAFVVSVVILGVALGTIGARLGYFALYFAVLSCVAEVSHYLCHVPPSKLTRRLGDWHVLLSRRYHARHHRGDNVQYAFLNGMSDPLLDWIATRFYRGYKSTTDLHYGGYTGIDTVNRSR